MKAYALLRHGNNPRPARHHKVSWPTTISKAQPQTGLLLNKPTIAPCTFSSRADLMFIEWFFKSTSTPSACTTTRTGLCVELGSPLGRDNGKGLVVCGEAPQVVDVDSVRDGVLVAEVEDGRQI